MKRLWFGPAMIWNATIKFVRPKTPERGAQRENTFDNVFIFLIYWYTVQGYLHVSLRVNDPPAGELN
jgi:hypothetical protein